MWAEFSLATALAICVTLSGWAAMFAVGLSWAIVAAGRREAEPVSSTVRPVAEPPAAVGDLTADEHYRLYLQADFVLGELDPILLETEELPDGRYRLRFIRRLEEYTVIDGSLSEVIDDDGDLAVDPAELRRND